MHALRKQFLWQEGLRRREDRFQLGKMLEVDFMRLHVTQIKRRDVLPPLRHGHHTKCCNHGS